MTAEYGLRRMVTAAVPRLVGDDAWIPVVSGGSVRHVNLDYAASAPPIVDVVNGNLEFLPWYSGVHRGTGFKSQIASAVYERARLSVSEFLDARLEDVVIFTRN